jgi:putative peptidoglycan lipid II flippase
MTPRASAQNDLLRKIVLAATTVGGFTMLVKLVAIAKEAAIARGFGRGIAVDGYVLAYTPIAMVVATTAASIQAAYVPALVAARAGGPGAIRAALARAAPFALGIALVELVGLALVGPVLLPALAGGTCNETTDVALSLYYIMLPYAALGGVAAILSALLNAVERFWFAAAVVAATPTITLIAVVLAGRHPSANVLGVSTTLGAIAEASLLAFMLKRLDLLPRRFEKSAAKDESRGLFFASAFSQVIVGACPLVDNYFAARLGAGGLSALAYGGKVGAAAVGIAATGLTTAVLPYFSSLAAARDWRLLRSTLWRNIALTFVVVLPCVVALYVATPLVVRLLFQRGAFTASDSAIVSSVQRMYVLQIPPYAIGVLAARLLVAMRANVSLIWINAGTLLTNAVADALLSRYMGVSGIALSTALGYLQSALIMLCLCELRLRTLTRGARSAPMHRTPPEGRAAPSTTAAEPLSRGDEPR